MQHVMSACLAAHASGILLNVLASNDDARAFYDSCQLEEHERDPSAQSYEMWWPAGGQP